MTRLWAMGLLTILALTSFAYGAQQEASPVAQSGPNVGQVDLAGPWSCPESFNGTIFADVPLSVALTTTGGPVQMQVTLTAQSNQAGTSGVLLFDPVIDGVERAEDRLFLHDTTWVFSRIYQLPAGQHVFAGCMACQFTFDAVHGWLSAYELPPVPKK
jgi:hypothetical protein